MLSAGLHKPVAVDRRTTTLSTDRAAFNADSSILAAGGSLRPGGKYSTSLWLPDSKAAITIGDCGAGIAWTYSPAVFACQNATGTHLRNVHDPQTDVGQAAPPSDLPVLKVGNSLWSAAYKITDWTDPNKPLPLTLVELGGGRRVDSFRSWKRGRRQRD